MVHLLRFYYYTVYEFEITNEFVTDAITAMGSISACLMFFCLIIYIQYSTADTYGYDNENTVQAYIKRALNAVHDSYQNLLNLVYEQQEKIGEIS
ncbi:hypothetical protein TrispH2_002044 [Trichoplax sp. H2]|nr:hypothetical protein TrispH2_002044 [Trichoplax sp. H2]|eukprot:RDD46525.1 hypothetical protein TrispH2_002044 [Trichoplax sp. H2]